MYRLSFLCLEALLPVSTSSMLTLTMMILEISSRSCVLKSLHTLRRRTAAHTLVLLPLLTLPLYSTVNLTLLTTTNERKMLTEASTLVVVGSVAVVRTTMLTLLSRGRTSHSSKQAQQLQLLPSSSSSSSSLTKIIKCICTFAMFKYFIVNITKVLL